MNSKFIDKCFKDKDGNVVLFQSPNIPLLGWLVCAVVSRFSEAGAFKTGTTRLGSALLFTWAFLELTQGVNYFRRLLGLAFFLSMTVTFFR